MRSYLKIQQLAANVGGIIKFLFVCGEIIVYYFRMTNLEIFLSGHFIQNENKANQAYDRITDNSRLPPATYKNFLNLDSSNKQKPLENINKETNIKNLNNMGSKQVENLDNKYS